MISFYLLHPHSFDNIFNYNYLNPYHISNYRMAFFWLNLSTQLTEGVLPKTFKEEVVS